MKRFERRSGSNQPLQLESNHVQSLKHQLLLAHQLADGIKSPDRDLTSSPGREQRVISLPLVVPLIKRVLSGIWRFKGAPVPINTGYFHGDAFPGHDHMSGLRVMIPRQMHVPRRQKKLTAMPFEN